MAQPAAPLRFVLPFLLLLSCASDPGPASPVAPPEPPPPYTVPLPAGLARTWIGPEYWANRLQDWRLRGGRLECVAAGPRLALRTVHLLTRRLGAAPGDFTMTVRTGNLAKAPGPEAWAGMLIGVGDAGVDHRLSAMTHLKGGPGGGLLVVVDGRGRVALRANDRARRSGSLWSLGGVFDPAEHPSRRPALLYGVGLDTPLAGPVDLTLEGRPDEWGYTLTVAAREPGTGRMLQSGIWEGVPADLVEGGVALVSHNPTRGGQGWWFKGWRMEGSKLTAHPDRALGPVLCALHTVSEGVLKMTAQMPPLGPRDARRARFEIRPVADGPWITRAKADLVTPGFTFLFRVERWRMDREVPYRIAYDLALGGGRTRTCYYTGTIRREPPPDRALVMAAFTGHKCFTGVRKWTHDGLWFPHRDLAGAVAWHKPDLLFFSGDQVYEGDLTGAVRRPERAARLDYLYKWYRWCWAFRDLARDIPCITIPDDHDVYHGNLWGAGGRAAKRQDEGGYRMSPAFVRMVERTQTGHLPDPVDPAPVGQGIGVYFTNLQYGGVDFAILEDRKFKSSPTVMVPEGRIVNGWAQAKGFDPVRGADVPGAQLLGRRQEAFLEQWARQWGEGVAFKVALSQTIFANLATLPAGSLSDGVVPRLAPVAVGAYPPDDRPVADADSNGWPQAGRNRALRALRRCFALHVAGDQHLGSTIRYGVDGWEDAGWALCVPSIANTFPRRWFPSSPGADRRPGAPPYTGRYRDGFGNRMTVYAVSNPHAYGREPRALHDRAPGYGIVRLDRRRRRVTLEVWPRWEDPARPGARQYPGWPITCYPFTGHGRKVVGHLRPLTWRAGDAPLISVYREDTGEHVYSLRPPGTLFRPMVFADGTYRVVLETPGHTPVIRRRQKPR